MSFCTQPESTPKLQLSRHSGRSKGYIAEYRPYAKTRALLDQVEQVLDEYRDYWPLTCRQIFYRMVGAHGYDKSEAAYGRLVERAILDLIDLGLLDADREAENADRAFITRKLLPGA